MHKWFGTGAEGRRKLLVVLSVVIAIIVLGLGAWGFYLLNSKKTTGTNPVQFEEIINKLESESPPKDPLQRALYYGQLGQGYDDIGQLDKSLDNFLKAQQVIDDNKLADQYVFYQAIADTYRSKGDKQLEKTYLEKQLKYLQDYQVSNPDDGGINLEAIKFVEGRIKAL